MAKEKAYLMTTTQELNGRRKFALANFRDSRHSTLLLNRMTDAQG